MSTSHRLIVFAAQLLVAVVFLTATCVAQAGTTTIDFDDLAGGPVYQGELVTDQYVGLGVTFFDTYYEGAHANNTLTSSISGASAPNVLWVAQGGGVVTGQYLEITFTNVIDSFSTTFGTSLDSSITLVAYNGNTLLNSQTLVGPTQIGDTLSGEIGYASSLGMTSVQLYSTWLVSGDSFNFSIDNVTYHSVPEPSSFALLGIGVISLLAYAWRRRQCSA
jgi:hypothetical protein